MCCAWLVRGTKFFFCRGQKISVCGSLVVPCGAPGVCPGVSLRWSVAKGCPCKPVTRSGVVVWSTLCPTRLREVDFVVFEGSQACLSVYRDFIDATLRSPFGAVSGPNWLKLS